MSQSSHHHHDAHGHHHPGHVHPPAKVHSSILRFSALQRLAISGALIALIWIAVLMATR